MPTPTLIPAKLSAHPAYRNPDATDEERSDLGARCPHPGPELFCGHAYSELGPEYVTFWCGCGVCGTVMKLQELKPRGGAAGFFERHAARHGWAA